MKPELAKYENTKICVAVSGGRDSMALLHYTLLHAAEYNISLSALNCDHGIRGEDSARDSVFVKEWCAANGVPLLTFVWQDDCEKTEALARKWRLGCYAEAIKRGVDAVATAHHMDDNAETVLFRLARGSSLSGLTGITDEDFGNLKIIRPLINCSRAEINDYISEHGVPYVDDETNFTENYTRNKIRLNVMPALEKAVNGASGAIFRFSRIAAEDELYFDSVIKERNLINETGYGVEIKNCKEKPVFRRAALKALNLLSPEIRDYTTEHLERLYALQFAETSKKFNFLGVTGYSENGKITLRLNGEETSVSAAGFFKYFNDKCSIYGGQFVEITTKTPAVAADLKILKFDLTAIPESAEIRLMKAGDRFTKFGGGTKKLGDYFTDKKIPVWLRCEIPLIAVGADILAVCGVEISDIIKVTDKTKIIAYAICADYANPFAGARAGDSND